MNLDESKLEAIRQYLSTRPVLRAYLFGSDARESADNESDIDILVELDYSQKIGLKMLNRKVDLVSSNGLSKYLKPIIDQEKKIDLCAVN